MIKFEKDLIAYGVEEGNYSIERGREHFQTKDVYKKEETIKVLAKGPHKDAMGQHNTKLISESFIKSVVLNKPELRKNSFKSSINSLSAVLTGVRQVQGTINGLGERCGNANLMSFIPTIHLKEHFSKNFYTF